MSDENFSKFLAWANANGYDTASTYDTERRFWAVLNPMTNDLWSAWKAARDAERDRFDRVAEAAQAVTTVCEDRIDDFVVPSHLMAALALALDETEEAKGGTTWVCTE